MNYYADQPSYSLEKYFVHIEDWLKQTPDVAVDLIRLKIIFHC